MPPSSPRQPKTLDGQPVSPKPWPEEAASASNAQRDGLYFASAPDDAESSAPAGSTPKKHDPGGRRHVRD
jgi:hypothetical protein